MKCSILNNLLHGKRSHPDLATEITRIIGNRNIEESSYDGPQDNLLLHFLSDEKIEETRFTLSEIIDFNNDEMEMFHDFIQWIYPTIEKSMAHPSAPTISTNFANKLNANKCALNGYCKSCRRYLNYMGLACDEHSNFHEISDSKPFWELPSHNYLRMTRMLNSLRETGHNNCSAKVYNMMISILKRDNNHWVSNKTLEYWKHTQTMSFKV